MTLCSALLKLHDLHHAGGAGGGAEEASNRLNGLSRERISQGDFKGCRKYRCHALTQRYETSRVRGKMEHRSPPEVKLLQKVGADGVTRNLRGASLLV